MASRVAELFSLPFPKTMLNVCYHVVSSR